MKIYCYCAPPGLDLPKEFVHVEEDATAWNYSTTGKETDIDVIPYMCKVTTGNGTTEYPRVRYKRLYEMYYKEVHSLEELESWLKECNENSIWFEIGYRNGVIQFDPWPE